MTNTRQGWASSPYELNKARVLRALTGDEVGSTDIVHVTAVADLLKITPEEVGAAFDALAHDGLATTFPRSMEDQYTSDAAVTSAGRARVANWDGASTQSARRRACLSAMLWWLDSDAGTGAAFSDGLRDDPRGYLHGVPFDRELVERTASDLRELGLVEGSGSASGTIYAPSLTALGQTVVERFGGDVSAWQAGTSLGNSSVVISGSTGVNVASHSPGAQQYTQAQSGAEEALNTLADALAQMPWPRCPRPGLRARG